MSISRKRRSSSSLVQSYAAVTPYVTKDRSIIRELMHPGTHRNKAQSLAEAIVPAGTRTLLHKHHVTEELYHVTEGNGLMTLGRKTFPVAVGDTVLIPPGTRHCIEASEAGQLKILCCSSPAYSHEDTELLEAEPHVAGQEVVQGDPAAFLALRDGARVGQAIWELRIHLGISQTEFWGRIGVLQSAGSRYESGHSIPNPVQILLRLAYVPDAALLAVVAELRAPFKDLQRSTTAAYSIEKWSTGRDLVVQRTALGLTQTVFWGAIGVSQSSGARYEQGLDVLSSATVALRLVFWPEVKALRHAVKLREGRLFSGQASPARSGRGV
jgi:mannose-6-phosphate isomerase-like protein (cupin superfamily)/transcriptional regulator with XRE-family HTH domain